MALKKVETGQYESSDHKGIRSVSVRSFKKLTEELAALKDPDEVAEDRRFMGSTFWILSHEGTLLSIQYDKVAVEEYLQKLGTCQWCGRTPRTLQSFCLKGCSSDEKDYRQVCRSCTKDLHKAREGFHRGKQAAQAVEENFEDAKALWEAIRMVREARGPLDVYQALYAPGQERTRRVILELSMSVLRPIFYNLSYGGVPFGGPRMVGPMVRHG